MENSLPDLFAKKFIARRDVKAVQNPDGSYRPVLKDPYNMESERIPWKREDLEKHLSGTATYGHYFLNQNNECKLFAFDIDLEKPNAQTGYTPYLPTAKREGVWCAFEPADARAAWRERNHFARQFMKEQFRMIAGPLAATIKRDLDIPVAVAYSGGKGIHVYGFTGLLPAEEVRAGAEIVLDTLGYTASRGTNFFKHPLQDPETGFPNLSVELFPKQTSLENKDLGNLMRLPLGRNQKSNDPTFFIDLREAIAKMKAMDPVEALTTTDPWRYA